MPKFNLEIKWNDSAKVSSCPLTGVEHQPWIGMYPFVAGSNMPVSFEAIAVSDPVVADEIFTLAWDVQRSRARLDLTEPPVVEMTALIEEDLLNEATLNLLDSFKKHSASFV